MVKLTCPRSTSLGIWHSLEIEPRSRNSHPTSSTTTPPTNFTRNYHISTVTSSERRLSKLEMSVCRSSYKLLISSTNSVFFSSNSLTRSVSERFASSAFVSWISVRLERTAFRYSFSRTSSSRSFSTMLVCSSISFCGNKIRILYIQRVITINKNSVKFEDFFQDFSRTFFSMLSLRRTLGKLDFH